MGLNDIVDILQQQGGPLLNLLGSGQIEGTAPPFHHRFGSSGGDRGLDFVAAEIGKLQGLADVDAVDDPR